MVLADVEELEDGGDRLLDDRRVKAVDDARAVFLSDDEPGVFEDVEVAGEGAGASWNCSANSPAVISRWRRSRKISRRVASLRAWKAAFIGKVIILVFRQLANYIA